MSEVTLKTSMGDITLELYTAHAPKTCDKFARLARAGQYDGTLFSRVIPGFVIQGGGGGDTTTTTTSNKGSGEREGELRNGLRHVGKGVVSMVNDTNGEFIITLRPTPELDGRYAIFGRVKNGLDVVNRIENVETRGEAPREDVRIERAVVV
ncbi:cyclophilin type peptidyl-prolyl cis-trans isomerase/CLD [Xylariaceae sp. FL0594]|nr:cyclophilin type peptidyl-prolyl cis-trans isomerase/CLD [Xylariaceae sp. FL0594]